MMGHRQFGWDDYLAIWRRRRLLIIAPAILGPVILLAVSLLLSARYESSTLVLIQSQKIPNSMVPPVVTDDLNARLATLQEQVLSRTRLESIIKQYNVFSGIAGQQPMELLVDTLRKSIELTPVKPIVKSRDQTLPGFSIAVTLSTPQLAQEVCAEIASLFISENLQQREQSAQSTAIFFESQVDDAKRQLNDQEARLADFKGQHIHELPDDTQTNLNLLGSLDGQLEAATQALSRAQQDKTYTESLLAEQVAAWKAGQTDVAEPQRPEQQLASLRNELAALQVRDTPEHPDVIKLQAEIVKVEAQLNHPAPSNPRAEAEARPTAEPASLQQLRNQVHAYEEAGRAARKTQERLQEQIELLQSRVQMSPVVEQQYKQLTRDHDMALDFYNDLLRKRNESEMATNLEQRQQSEQFLVMDPANLPKEPTFPNRPVFALAGLGAGLGFGFFLVWLLETRDKAVRNEKDVQAFLGLRTLAMLPVIANQTAAFRAGPPRKLGIPVEDATGI
jgi:polysaccharide chain length determinant protein (PEP-CTERM system associated)